MSTATRVTIDPVVAPNPEAITEIENGLGAALDAMTSRQWDSMYDALTDVETEPEAVGAFEDVQRAAAAEIAPAVARLLAEAINRRLPWTWEPER